jgi:ubiquinone/menaquinone biosynthesis C-methylase UbiE
MTGLAKYSTLDEPMEVPCQVECYLFCRDKYLRTTDTVLDVGFGLGYGLQIMASKVGNLIGIDVDAKAIERAKRIFYGSPRVRAIMTYDGERFPFGDRTFDVVTCVEVIEHVDNYRGLLLEMARVSRRLIFIATANRRPENTRSDGRPKNYWHLREWTKDELDTIFAGLRFRYEWNFLNGCFEGPFIWTQYPRENAWSLVPVILCG